jgi:predicted transcriptional regulator
MFSVSPNPGLSACVARIVSAYVANHSVEAAELPSLIRSVQTVLSALDAGGAAGTPVEEKPTPAVPVKRSVFPDYIVCLEDGKKLKSLKRHLQTAYGLTPEQYRERWGLPSTYPMVAPNYSLQRSGLAKRAGLGRKKPGLPELNEAADEPAPPTPQVKAGMRGRKSSSAKP